MSRPKQPFRQRYYSEFSSLDVDGLSGYRAQSKSGCKLWTAIRCGVFPDDRFKAYCVDCGRLATVHDHRDWRLPLQVDLVCHSCNSRRGSAAPFEDEPRTYDGRVLPKKPNNHPKYGFLQLLAEATTEPFE